MVRISNTSAMLILAIFSFSEGCSGLNHSPSTVENTPTLSAIPTYQAPPVRVEPTAVPSLTPGINNKDRLLNHCSLIDSRDIASFYSSAEVQQPIHELSVVDHTIFSTQDVSARESSCLYYAFHRPGKLDEEMLQVTYWVDVPNHATPDEWAQLFSNAISKGAEAISGFEDGAFYDNGKLTTRKGEVYLTIEVIGTKLDTDTSQGGNQQTEMEKQLALDALSRLDITIQSSNQARFGFINALFIPVAR